MIHVMNAWEWTFSSDYLHVLLMPHYCAQTILYALQGASAAGITLQHRSVTLKELQVSVSLLLTYAMSTMHPVADDVQCRSAK